MKNITRLSTLLLFILWSTACEDASIEPVDPAAEISCEEQPLGCNLAEANSEFAIDLWQQINQEEEPTANIFISPFSISTALTMTMNGAANSTYEQMETTLHTDHFARDERNDAFQSLLTSLPNLDEKVALELANSIWTKADYPVLQSFLDVNTLKFNSELYSVDFLNDDVITRVNAWVEDKTNGLIKNAVEELPGNVVMLIINAIYFKGDWKTEFDPENTQMADFYTSAGTQQVEMMRMPEVEMPYLETDIFQAVDLAYGDSIYSMSVFVPKADYSVADITSELTSENWTDWTSSFANEAIDLALPKFKMEYEIKLKSTLKAMGMTEAFSDVADFTQIVELGGVKIDDVIHKAFIEVDEVGTEAAAVTVVIIIETSAPALPTVRADKPFLFVIRENQTNSILFMGRLSDPA